MFGLFDTTAKYDATFSTNSIQPFANLYNTVKDDYRIPKYATMEPKQTLLDGSFLNFPDNTVGKDFGYWSLAMSDKDGRFGTDESPLIPEIEISFTEKHSSAGLTFRFADAFGEWISDFEIWWYDQSNEIIGYGHFHPEETEFFASRKITNYMRILIRIHGTNKPYRYAKIESIDFGLTYRLGNDNLVGATLTEEIHAISANVHINKLECKIQSDFSDFYAVNPEGLFSLLQERQRLVVSEVIGDTTVGLGTYFLDEISSETDKVTILRAIDLMGIIEKSKFNGGVYEDISASELIGQIMQSANVDYTLAPSLESMRLSGHIPTCSHREAIQHVVFVLGAVATSARSDVIHIYPQSIYPTRYIGPDEKFYKGPVTMKTLVTAVETYAYTYEDGDESKELLNDYLAEGEYEIPFSDPVNVDSLSLSSGEILEKNSNFAIIKVPYGETVLTGRPYIKQARRFIKELRDLPNSVSDTVEVIDTATMVSPSYGQEVCDRAFNYFQKRHTVTFGMVATDIVPSDVVQVGFVSGGQISGTVERMKTDLTGGFLAEITINFASLIERPLWDYAGEFYAADDVGVI